MWPQIQNITASRLLQAEISMAEISLSRPPFWDAILDFRSWCMRVKNNIHERRVTFHLSHEEDLYISRENTQCKFCKYNGWWVFLNHVRSGFWDKRFTNKSFCALTCDKLPKPRKRYLFSLLILWHLLSRFAKLGHDGNCYFRAKLGQRGAKTVIRM